MTKFLVLICFILTSTASIAAVAPPAAYLRSDQRLILNGEKYQRRFFSATFDVGDGFSSNAAAAEEYRLHRVWGVWGAVFLFGSIVTLTAYSVIAYNNDSYDSNTALFLFWLPEFFVGAFSFGKSQAHLLRAINLYNGVPGGQASLRPEVRFANAGTFAPSLGLKFSF